MPTRLETFTDAVFAILITIMVLELRSPEGTAFSDLSSLLPLLLSYALSFVYLLIYWNNHHQMFKTVKRPTGGIMWANAHLLFWLSLVPFATGWLGTSHGAIAPTILYGIALLFPAIAYYILQSLIITSQGAGSVLAEAVGPDIKGKLSPVLYIAGIASAFISPFISYAFYVAVALMWIVPDKRIERTLGEG